MSMRKSVGLNADLTLRWCRLRHNDVRRGPHAQEASKASALPLRYGKGSRLYCQCIVARFAEADAPEGARVGPLWQVCAAASGSIGPD